MTNSSRSTRSTKALDQIATLLVTGTSTGATLAELMARLGHSTPSAALRYQHAAQGRDAQIAAALSALVAR